MSQFCLQLFFSDHFVKGVQQALLMPHVCLAVLVLID